MKYTKPLLVPLLSCSLGLSVTLGMSKNALCEEESKTGTSNTSEHTQFLPKVEVHIKYSVDGRSFRELSDGETLRSGQFYRVEFTPLQDCQISVLQTDGTGNLQPLEKANKILVKANVPRTLPDKDKAYYLDDVTGQETIYFQAFHLSENTGSGEESKGSGGIKLVAPPLPNDCTVERNCVKSVTFQHDK